MDRNEDGGDTAAICATLSRSVRFGARPPVPLPVQNGEGRETVSY